MHATGICAGGAPAAGMEGRAKEPTNNETLTSITSFFPTDHSIGWPLILAQTCPPPLTELNHSRQRSTTSSRNSLVNARIVYCVLWVLKFSIS